MLKKSNNCNKAKKEAKMKSRNRILLSCIVASLVATSGYADCASQNYIISDANTTGVLLNCIDDNLTVTSTGSITVVGSSSSVKAIDSSSSGFITNSGTVTLNGNNANAYGIYSYGNANITNSGTINTTANGNNIYNNGIYSHGNANITNSGTITLNGNNANANGIYSHGNANITNSGTINVDGAESYGMWLAHGNANITNSGTMIVDGNLSLGIVSRHSGLNLINSGTISISTNAGGTAIGIYSDRNETITNSGTIKADTAFMSEGSGSILNTSTGVVNTYNIYAPVVILTNSGTINLHGTQTSHIGTFTQTASGTLSIDANISADGTATNPTIRATNATLSDGSTINVNVISDSSATTQSFLGNNGTINNVIDSNNTLDANVSKLNITDSSPILDFKAFMNDTNTTLSLKAIRDATVSPTDSPLISTVAPTVNMQVLNVLNTVIQTRQNSSRGMGSGDIAFKDKHLWIKPFGAYSKQDDKDSKYGFDAHTYGVGIGTDGEYKQGNRAGLAFFYSNTDLDVNHVSQSNSIDAYNIITYGSNPIVDDKTMLFYQAGFGWQKNHSKRYAPLVGKTATADYTSKTYYIQAKVARSYAFNDKLTLVPAVKGSYRYFRIPSYTESGAGSLNDLSVQSNSSSQVLFGVSTDLNYKINDTTRFISNLALNYDFNNDRQSINAFFAGTPNFTFNTQGIKNSAFGYELGLGVSKRLRKNIMFNVKYDLTGRGNDFMNHAVIAKFRWTF